MTLYNEYGIWLKNQLGVKSQKISLNAGFTCPNRDGRVGTGGCTYCNNQTFNPDYCITTKSITQQLEEGKQFFARKYPDMKYLAYFQAYTNTYDSLPNLIAKYEEALSVLDVIGLVIGTRPDCMPDVLLDYLEELNQRTFLVVEYGIESVYDATLQRINRGHTHAQTVDAIQRTAARGIRTGAHLILGLPGEGREAILAEADILSSLPLTTSNSTNSNSFVALEWQRNTSRIPPTSTFSLPTNTSTSSSTSSNASDPTSFSNVLSPNLLHLSLPFLVGA